MNQTAETIPRWTAGAAAVATRRGFFAARAWRPKIKATVRWFVVVMPHVPIEDRTS
jgi:hypothetical protein